MISLVTLSAGGTVAFYGIGLWSNNAEFYRSLVMPAVRWLDPETAHRAAVLAAKYRLVPRDRNQDPAVLVRTEPETDGRQIAYRGWCLGGGWTSHG